MSDDNCKSPFEELSMRLEALQGLRALAQRQSLPKTLAHLVTLNLNPNQTREAHDSMRPSLVARVLPTVNRQEGVRLRLPLVERQTVEDVDNVPPIVVGIAPSLMHKQPCHHLLRFQRPITNLVGQPPPPDQTNLLRSGCSKCNRFHA